MPPVRRDSAACGFRMWVPVPVGFVWNGNRGRGLGSGGKIRCAWRFQVRVSKFPGRGRDEWDLSGVRHKRVNAPFLCGALRQRLDL